MSPAEATAPGSPRAHGFEPSRSSRAQHEVVDLAACPFGLYDWHLHSPSGTNDQCFPLHRLMDPASQEFNLVRAQGEV